jgi:hypothetical protein
VFFDSSEQDWEAQPPPDGPMTLGIDGRFVRAAHKEGFFEVIAGKSIVDFRRSDEEVTCIDPKHSAHNTSVAAGRFEGLWR